MTSTRTLATSLMSLTTAALFAFCSAGQATAAPASPDTKDVAGVSSAAVTDTTGADYWTPERMRSAVPADVLAKKAVDRQKANPAVLPEQAQGPGNQDPGLHTPDPDEDQRQRNSRVPHRQGVLHPRRRRNYVCSGQLGGCPPTRRHRIHRRPLPQRRPGQPSPPSSRSFPPTTERRRTLRQSGPPRRLYAPAQWNSPRAACSTTRASPW